MTSSTSAYVPSDEDVPALLVVTRWLAAAVCPTMLVLGVIGRLDGQLPEPELAGWPAAVIAMSGFVAPEGRYALRHPVRAASYFAWPVFLVATLILFGGSIVLMFGVLAGALAVVLVTRSVARRSGHTPFPRWPVRSIG